MRLETEILQGLNPAQREAVEAIEGPLLIVAGPGSGKTRVITHRIAYLIRVCGISPHRILAVTFTNKAAREMKDRLQRLVGTRTDQMTVGTFHAFCAAILRRDGKYIGLDSNFTIYDDEDQRNLLKQAMELADTDPRSFPPRAIQSVISRAKCLMLDSHALSLNYKSYFEEQAAKVYQRYEELITRNNGVDFDDLLLKAVQILQVVSGRLAKSDTRINHDLAHTCLGGLARSLPEEGLEIFDDILVGDLFLHRQGRTQHMHQHYRCFASRRHGHHPGVSQSGYIVNDRGSQPQAFFRHIGLKGVDGNRHAEFWYEPLDDRLDPPQFVLGGERLRAGTCALSSHIDDIGALAGHLLRMFDGSVDSEETAAI